jgi:hypothetical protein
LKENKSLKHHSKIIGSNGFKLENDTDDAHAAAAHAHSIGIVLYLLSVVSIYSRYY